MAPSAEQIASAAALIRADGVVAFPTETVYGLGANALSPAAVRKIYEIKQRPATSPLIVHVNSVHMAQELVSSWPLTAETLAARFWPGPLTLVLPRKTIVPHEITAGLDTVGVRMPAHPVALALIEAAGLPIAAPSANRFTQLSPTTAAHVAAGLGAAVDLILDGGPTDVGIESTVLSLAGDQPILLRPGMISQAAIESVIGPIAVAGETTPHTPHASPGQHDKHYSPRTPLYLLSAGEPLPASGAGTWIYHSTPRPATRQVQLPASPGPYAAMLYETLHAADATALDWIAVEAPPDGVEWAGVTDRLNRARFR
jgi:L-threonylcarbamoyladenylate synthase